MSAAAGATWWQRLRAVLLGQLRQGITPEKIALTLGIGLVLGMFPILGTTTALCLALGALLRLNQPLLQLANWAAAPLQLPAIYLFVRVGEHLTRTAPVPFAIEALIGRFRAAPLQFLRDFGMTGVRAVLAWLLIAPAIVALIYALALPPLRRLARMRAAVRSGG